ncbi:uncharacterized protein LOC141690432 [Apium graveolens]|uniref:uncharacterized protein LOC141690432 n=1 Tax=Apium graveolens TaxID=4045 RepID=UPI003D7AD668
MTDMGNPQFELGMLFSSGTIFRAAVRKHAIVQQRPIRLKKNLANKIKWICSGGCEWKCYGIKQQRLESIQIKTFLGQHTCNPTWEQKCVNSTWITAEYEDEIRMNPTWPTQAFHSRVVNDLKCKISLAMIYRALKKAKDNILGKHEMEYAKVFAYANEIKKQMPTSTVKIMSEQAEPGVTDMRFKRFYVCLGPLKEGFLDGCRPLIGLDGCHLKGPLDDILLTAVATDPNDGMYPLAWAQVEAENNDSWEWFIRLLKDDLRMENEGSYTFISDRQKGLVNALESQVSAAEHRFCVMHQYKNLWKEHKGIGVRRLLWSAAKSTTDYHHNMNMGALKKLAPRAYEWLAAKPKSQWTRSAFREVCKSDMFFNNNCEVFNHAINKFRDMSIVTMMKSIQITCMERICKRLTRMEQKDTVFCNKPLKKLQRSMEMAARARPSWNGGSKYLVTMTEGGHQIVCDLQNHYMHECHKKEWYLRVYSHILEPLNGEEFWEETNETPILPPLPRIAPGRPKKKGTKLMTLSKQE